MKRLARISGIGLMLTLLTPLPTQARPGFYIESDPMAFMLSGHSLHTGAELDGFRVQLGTFAASHPDFILTNKNFSVHQAGYGIKFDFFGRSGDGWFVGIEHGRTEIQYTLRATQEKITRAASLVGVRTGYKHRFGKHLYVTPWISISRNLSDTTPVTLSGQSYQAQAWFVFPTVHIGMDF